MAYGVDKFPNPVELSKGHIEYDRDDEGLPIKKWIRDFDEDGRRIEDEEQEEAL